MSHWQFTVRAYFALSVSCGISLLIIQEPASSAALSPDRICAIEVTPLLVADDSNLFCDFSVSKNKWPELLNALSPCDECDNACADVHVAHITLVEKSGKKHWIAVTLDEHTGCGYLFWSSPAAKNLRTYRCNSLAEIVSLLRGAQRLSSDRDRKTQRRNELTPCEVAEYFDEHAWTSLRERRKGRAE